MQQLSRFTRIVVTALSVSPLLSAHPAQQRATAAPATEELRIEWLGQASFAPARSPAQASADLADLVATERRHVVVQFSRTLSESERASVRGAGLELLSYLGHQACSPRPAARRSTPEPWRACRWRPSSRLGGPGSCTRCSSAARCRPGRWSTTRATRPRSAPT